MYTLFRAHATFTEYWTKVLQWDYLLNKKSYKQQQQQQQQ